MSMQFEDQLREEAIFEVAKKMAIAARTAPKGKGIDTVVIAVIKGDTIREIAQKMKEMVGKGEAPAFFERDANNILQSPVMLLLGTRIKSLGLNPCGMCGYKSCEEKNRHPDHPCVFNTGDLGIAVGSAVSVAMDSRVDNRIMYTVGQAVMRMGLLGDEIKVVYGVPLSVSAKNPFFDRK